MKSLKTRHISFNAFAFLCPAELTAFNLVPYQPQHDKSNKKTCLIRPVWSETSLSTCRKFGSLGTHKVHGEDSVISLGECPGGSESLLGAHAILLVLSWGSSIITFIACIISPVWSCIVILHTVIFLGFQTDRSGQTVQTQIRLLLEEQSDQGLHCLQFPLHLLDAFL